MKLCECGCGLPAPIATMTSKRNGWIKGEAKRFITTHNRFVEGKKCNGCQTVLPSRDFVKNGRMEPKCSECRKATTKRDGPGELVLAEASMFCRNGCGRHRTVLLNPYQKIPPHVLCERCRNKEDGPMFSIRTTSRIVKAALLLNPPENPPVTVLKKGTPGFEEACRQIMKGYQNDATGNQDKGLHRPSVAQPYYYREDIQIRGGNRGVYRGTVY